MPVVRPLVSVVDDDESIRESLPDLLAEFGFDTRTFSSANEFLTSVCVDTTNCLILDVNMPGMSGVDLHRELVNRGYRIPIVYITALRDDSIRSHLIQEGAVECLFKPFSDVALLDALRLILQGS